MKISLAVALTLILSAIAYSQPCLLAAREVPPVLSAETKALYEKNLSDAEAVHLDKLNDADAILWLGRRTAYLGHYKNAVRIFSSGGVLFKNDPRFLRHRGHRYITLRCFDDAIKDLEKAAEMVRGKPDEIEPDGLPNAKNIPTSTLQSNIWYHLGLAYYLKGDFRQALRAYEEAQKVATNNDMRVATSYWHYLTLQRLGKKNSAKKFLRPFAGKIEVIENDEYLKLIRLYRGEMRYEDIYAQISSADTLSSATLGYGLGIYDFNKGAHERAHGHFGWVLQGNQWASFGFIASEQDILRVRVAP